jgi:hypothetical protein
MPFVVYGNGTRRFPLYETTLDSVYAVTVFSIPRRHILFGFLFDIVSGAWVVAKVYNPRKTIQAVADGNI